MMKRDSRRFRESHEETLIRESEESASNTPVGGPCKGGLRRPHGPGSSHAMGVSAPFTVGAVDQLLGKEVIIIIKTIATKTIGIQPGPRFPKASLA